MSAYQAIKNLRLTVKIGNNQLKERREALGLSAPQFAAKFGIEYGAYSKLESMKASPLTSGKRGGYGKPEPITWRSIALAVAAAHRVTPDILWPESVLAIEKVQCEARVDAEEVAALVSSASAPSPLALLEDAERRDAVRKALSTLTPREEQILRMRFGLDGKGDRTCAEVGVEYDISVGRVNQIEAKALHKLRHPSRYQPMLDAGWADEFAPKSPDAVGDDPNGERTP